MPSNVAARILHPVDVVDLGVGRVARRKIVAVDPVDVVERHGLGRRLEHRRLVHVVPEAGEAVVDEILVERRPTRRASLLRVKSGKTDGPGQTGAT